MGALDKLPPGFVVQPTKSLPPGFQVQPSNDRSASTAVPRQEEQPGFLQDVMGAVKNLGIGGLKSVAGTGAGIGNLLSNLTGRSPDTAQADSEQQGGPINTAQNFLSGPKRDTPRELAPPEGLAQKTGKFAADTAQYFLPGKIGSAPVSLLGRMLRGGAEAGGVASAQTGELQPGAAALGAAMPAMGAALNPTKNKLIRGATEPVMNDLETAAVQYADEGAKIPIDMAVRTGNPTLQGIKAGTRNMPSIGKLAKQAKLQTERALQQRGRELVAETGGGVAAGTQAGAGERMLGGVRQAFQAAKDTATAGYNNWRQLIGQPQNVRVVETGIRDSKVLNPMTGLPFAEKVTKQLTAPVNVAEYTSMAKGIIDEIGEELPNASDRLAESYAALKNIAKMDDWVPLEQLNNEVSALGYLSFYNKHGLTREKKDAIIQGVWKPLREMVDKATAEYGGEAGAAALQQGRIATAKYFRIDNFAKKLGGRDLDKEGKQVFQALVSNHDGGIQALRRLKEIAPEQVSNAARGTLQTILDEAVEEGGFKGAKALGVWNNLGPETKQLLFKDPERVERISKFFQLAKMTAQDSNPSGSGSVLAAMGQLGWAIHNPMSASVYYLTNRKIGQMLYNADTAETLTKALQTPVNVPGSRTLYTALYLSSILPDNIKRPKDKGGLQ